MFVLILMQPLFLKCAEIKANAMFAFKAKENMPAKWLWRIMTYLPLPVCFEHISIICYYHVEIIFLSLLTLFKSSRPRKKISLCSFYRQLSKYGN